MVTPVSPLRFGCIIKFHDRWQGRLSAIEVTEDWEVINVGIKRGIPHRAAVRLPLEAAVAWDDDHIDFGALTSRAAFSREVPPMAAPARPLSEATPVTPHVFRLGGVLIIAATRRVSELLMRRGGRLYRVPVDQTSFEGKTLLLAAQSQTLLPYYPDAEIREIVRGALSRSRDLTSGELRALEVEAEGGATVLRGNVRTKHVSDAVTATLSRALPGLPLKNEVIDDISLESELGLALNQAGLDHVAQVYIRSNLGDVTLFGYAPSTHVIDEIVRTLTRFRTVRGVQSRIQVRPSPSRPAAPSSAA